jgi:hypothetical protein
MTLCRESCAAREGWPLAVSMQEWDQLTLAVETAVNRDVHVLSGMQA